MPSHRIAARALAARAGLTVGDSDAAHGALADAATADAPEFAIEFAQQAWSRFWVQVERSMGTESQWQVRTLRASTAAFGVHYSEHVNSARRRLLTALSAMQPHHRHLGRPARPMAWTLAAALAFAERRLTRFAGGKIDGKLDDDLDEALARARELLRADDPEREVLEFVEQNSR